MSSAICSGVRRSMRCSAAKTLFSRAISSASPSRARRMSKGSCSVVVTVPAPECRGRAPAPHASLPKAVVGALYTRRRCKSELTHEAAIENPHASFALHRFEDERGDRLSVERGGEILEVALRNRDACCEWSEGKSIARPIRRRERREEPAVKCAAQRNDLVFYF